MPIYCTDNSSMPRLNVDCYEKGLSPCLLIYGIDGAFHIRGQPRDPSSPLGPSLISFHFQSSGCPLPLVNSRRHLFHGLSLISYTDPTQDNYAYPFNYVPSFAAGVTFVALFSLMTSMSFSLSLSREKPLILLPIVLHLIQALHKRMWWLFPTVVTGGVAEIIGWSGRLWGSKNPTSMDPYLMQFVPQLLFVAAANLFPVQDHDYHHQPYVYPRRQLRDSGTDHPDSRVPIQSFETPFM